MAYPATPERLSVAAVQANGTLGLEPERCAVKQVAISDYDKVPQMIEEFVEEIIEMGPNPFKGF